MYKRKQTGGRPGVTRVACCLTGALALAGVAGLALAAPPLAAERLTVKTLPPRSPHWVWVYDLVLNNDIDGRVYLMDGDTGRRLGEIDGGYWPGIAESPDGKTTAMASSYFARGSRGERTDVVEFTNNATLDPPHEVIVPPKRVQTLPSLFNLGYSSDGHFVYVANVTPATSVSVVDAQHNALLGEIETAGCVLVYPGGPNRVSSLCENGRALTISLDANGKESGREQSDPFYDPDTDPMFVQGIPSEHGVTFLTHLGQVREVDFSGPKAIAAPAWSLVTPAEKGQWRPGGNQIGALHRKLGRLYVPMHKGGPGTHKVGGSEIWVFDTRTHQRLARWPFAARKLAPTLAIQVSQDDQPLLFITMEEADLVVMDALTGTVQRIERKVGQSPWLMLNP